MPTLPSTPVPLHPLATLALLAVLCALPAPLLLLWRRRALRAPADPARPAWFGFAIRVQFLLLASAWVAAPVASRLPVRAALEALGAGPPLVVRAIALLALGLPLLAHVAMTTAVAGDVERRLRGVEWSARERLLRLAAGIGPLLPFVAGIVVGAYAVSQHQPRAAIAAVLGGVIAALVLSTTRASTLGFSPQAASTGALRDRIVELAARAGVQVRQVFVLAAGGARMANAFAVQGGSVVLTDHLLAGLSRREVDAVVAHELAHLRARHPARLQWTIVLAGVLGSPLLLLPIGAWSWALLGAVVWATYLAVSRRIEYEADRGAVELCGDAEALISGLARIAALSHFPVHWSRALEWTLTHPSTRRRALAIARDARIEPSRIEALLDPGGPPTDRYACDAAARRIFGTPARQAHGAAASWALLAASASAPAAVLAAVAATGAGIPRLAALAAATAAAFVAALAASNRTATGPQREWERRIAERLVPPSGSVFGGLAPGPDDGLYEGWAQWDLGFLAIEPSALRWLGEESRFTLVREQIVAIEVTPGLPGWLRTPRVEIRWRDDDGRVHALGIRDARARALHEIPSRTTRLHARLREWHARPAPPSVHVLAGDRPPRAEDVSYTPMATLVAPSTLVPVAFLLVLLAGFATAAAGLPWAPAAGPGACDVFGAAFGAMVLLRVPAWSARRRGAESLVRHSAERAA